MATWTVELTQQVKYVSPPGAKFITAHLHGMASNEMLESSSLLSSHSQICNGFRHCISYTCSMDQDL